MRWWPGLGSRTSHTRPDTPVRRHRRRAAARSGAAPGRASRAERRERLRQDDAAALPRRDADAIRRRGVDRAAPGGAAGRAGADRSLARDRPLVLPALNGAPDPVALRPPAARLRARG